ncbi:MAG TPA: NAD(P)H-hydrate dehydratase, partial [Acetobacteraceae bacterium]|nr:NAD(P)H-hydrate dehydratase [Acetobacteraceae bacterium]
ERTASDHKYTRGHLSILSGELAGASVLAAMAARRVGAGLVTLVAEHPPEAPYGVMRRTDPLPDLLADERRRVWLCGPGLGRERAGKALAALIEAGRTIVADADALTACAGAPERLRGADVITPHAGEFVRVFGAPGDDRLNAAREAASRCGAVVVLKGADTIIASPDGRAAINDHASAALATAGTGDTLAGMIAGLLGQGMAAFEAAAAAVWLHGEAGLRIGPGLIAEDIADHLPEAMAEARRIKADLSATPRYNCADIRCGAGNGRDRRQ